MKKTTLLAALCFFGIVAIAQPTPEMERRMERMESARIAKITTDLELTTAEAAKFWPVYNEMRSKIKALVKERHAAMQQLESAVQLPLAEREALVLANFEREKNLVAIKQHYHQKFKDVIGLEKTLKLHDTERKMQYQMVQHMRKNKQEKGNGNQDQVPE